MLVFLKKKDIFYFFHSKQKRSIMEVIDFFYVTFKIILLKIDRPPTLLAHLHILFVVGKVFVIKRKTMAHTEETIKKWKQEFFWLLFTTAQKLICAVGTSQKEIINETFIAGSTNYQLSSLGDHSKSESLQCVVREEEHNKALKEKSSLPLPKILHNVPADSTISVGLKNMGEKEKQAVEKPSNDILSPVFKTRSNLKSCTVESVLGQMRMSMFAEIVHFCIYFFAF